MPASRQEPEWVAPFLAALAACGNVTRSAGLAGVDVTGVYNRRNRYPEFKAACERVLAERAERALRRVRTASTSSVAPQDARPFDTGAALPTQDERSSAVGPACDGVKVSRVAAGRWSKGTEERFLAELTACANVARAAAAVGFSAASAYKRRAKDRQFADGWDAAIAVGRARLEAHLIAAADRTFDPDTLPIAEGAPTVSVGEAISILKHKPAGSGGGDGRARARALGYMDWVTDEDVDEMERAEEVRKSIHDKLQRLIEQDEERRLAAGYTRHGEDWIPPGWVYVGAGAGAEP